MTPLLMALVAQAPADPLALAREALKAGRVEAALEAFEARLVRVPADVDARVGAGFAALRLGRVDLAAQHFEQVLTQAPRYADAAFGLALCRERAGRLGEARVLIHQACALAPGRTDFEEASRRLDPAPLPPFERPAALQLPFRVDLQGFHRSDGRGGWTPCFIKGINLGAALPGRFPSEFPDKATYEGWIRDMADLGVNAVRVYTIHPPAFYEALRAHNLKAASPIHLIHGVWVEPPPGNNFEDRAWFEDWRQEMARVVDLLHGRADLPERPGHAAGTYRADVSPWWIATILGREWEPSDLWAFHQQRPGEADWTGRFVAVERGNATERFMARAMDAFLALEHDRYHAQRPMAFTSWPTLDPLHHPTETAHAEEVAVRERLGLRPILGEDRHWDEDAISLDMEKFRSGPEARAGLFASYHAYPYYPDFMNLDRGYARVRDGEGPNSYLGYLRDLVRHHARTPVFIAEFGVPSSRISIHVQPQGFHHGGQNERQQGEQDARLFRSIHASGCAGGLLFALVDEWFKKCWLTQHFELPPERDPLWFNPLDAEEAFGLIGMHPGATGPTIRVDGRDRDWAAIPIHQEGGGLRLKLIADEGWLHVGLWWKGALGSDGFLLGFDTFDAILGNHALPFGIPLRSEAGLEGVLRVDSREAAIWLDQPVDAALHRHARPYATVDHAGGPWLQPQVESNRERVGRDGTVYPALRADIGQLRKGTQDRSDPGFDSGAEWHLAPTAEGGFLEARIPWGLLNVTDPSQRRVIKDVSPLQDAFGTTRTPGFRIVAVRHTQPATGAPRVLASLPEARGGAIPMPPPFTWPAWEQPRWHAFRKQGFALLKAALSALPDRPTPRSDR